MRLDALDLEFLGVDGVQFVGFHEALHVDADSLAHDGTLAAREQGGEATDVVNLDELSAGSG